MAGEGTRMKSLHFGSAMIDIIALVASENIERASFSNDGKSFLMLEAGRKVPAQSITTHVGGGACNTGVSLARRGWDAAVLAKVGDDLNASAVRDHLARNGATDRLVVGEEATGTAVMIASHDRNASIFVHRGANETLTEGDLPKMDGVDLVYVAPLSSASADCLPAIAARGRAAKAMVAVNAGIRHLTSRGAQVLECLKDVDLISINRVEAEAMVPFLADRSVCAEPPIPGDAPELLARGLLATGHDMGLISFMLTLKSMGPAWVLITDGVAGAYLAGPEDVMWHPSVEAEVAGTAGAGDAFCSTLVAALAEGRAPQHAMAEAALASSSVVSHVDTTTGLLTRDQMAQALERLGGPRVRKLGRPG